MSLALPSRRIILTPRRTVLRASFDGADSASALRPADTGQPATARVGTWGHSSGAAYSATDTSGDMFTFDAGVTDGTFRVSVRGEHIVAMRMPNVVFRCVNTTNFMQIRHGVAAVRMYVVIGGSQTEVASASRAAVDDTWYTWTVQLAGKTIAVAANNVALLTHTLSDANYAALGGGTSYGGRLEKSGSPTMIARWDDLSVTRAG